MGTRIVAVLALMALVTGCDTPAEDEAGLTDAGAGGRPVTVPPPPPTTVTGLPDPRTAEGQRYFQQVVGDRVFFETDSSDITPEGQQTLQRQAELLRQYQGIGIVIEGHADERGTRDYNLALGERRANSVRAYLTALGIPANRVRTVSFGKERPVPECTGSTARDWQCNRRAVTVIQ